ncbi:MAG: hypothetical protein ACJ76N_25570 [Thermoanaerobaculia bacterium]
MKTRLLFVITVLAAALFLPTSKAAAANNMQCFEENYGSQCGTTCVIYNDQGNIDKYATYLHAC